MNDGKLEVLFLCAHNSARSIMAEAILNHLGAQRFRAHSAGLAPADAPHPFALDVLRQASIPADGMRSKGWQQFVGASAPAMDLVITMSDTVASQPAPQWAGHPVVVGWNFPDPLEAQGSESVRKEVFRSAMYEIRRRIELLLNLPQQGLDRLRLEQELAGMVP